MIITISGTPGSGKSTVGKMLAKKLGYKYYSIGAMRRAMAVERGLTLQQLNVLGEKQPFTDREVDLWQKKLGQTKDNLIVEGRTSFYFIPHSVKLFLKANMLVAAKRTFHDFAHVRRFEATKHYTTPQQLVHGFRHRMASDTRRYRKYYHLDIFLPKHYDLVLDSTKLTPKQTLEKILQYLAKVSQKKTIGDSLGTKKEPVHKKINRKKVRKTTKNNAKVRQKRAH